MKTVNLSTKLVNLNGAPIEIDGNFFTAGDALSKVLLAHRGKRLDHFKLYSLAQKANDGAKSDATEFDASDTKSIIEIVLQDESFSPLVNGQLLEMFQ